MTVSTERVVQWQVVVEDLRHEDGEVIYLVDSQEEAERKLFELSNWGQKEINATFGVTILKTDEYFPFRNEQIYLDDELDEIAPAEGLAAADQARDYFFGEALSLN